MTRYFARTNLSRNIYPVHKHLLPVLAGYEPKLDPLRQSDHLGCLLGRKPFLQNAPSDGPVHSPGIDVHKAERFGDEPGYRALPRSRRSVDCDVKLIQDAASYTKIKRTGL